MSGQETLPALHFTIVSCSLDPDSRSRQLAFAAQHSLQAAGVQVTLIDLRGVLLPGFDNHDIYRHPQLPQLHRVIREADGVLLATPVYNWGVAGAAKTLVEVTGSTEAERGLTSAWFDQLVTFLVAGGLPHSYMAHTSFASALMLDFKCVINPYHVYATGRDWTGSEWSAQVTERLEKTLRVKIELAERLRGRTYRSDWEL